MTNLFFELYLLYFYYIVIGYNTQFWQFFGCLGSHRRRVTQLEYDQFQLSARTKNKSYFTDSNFKTK